MFDSVKAVLKIAIISKTKAMLEKKIGIKLWEKFQKIEGKKLLLLIKTFKKL